MARVAAANKGSQAEKVYILKFKVLDDEYVQDDTSGKNGCMEDVASAMEAEDANNYLELVEVYEVTYSPSLRLFYFLYNRDQFTWHELSDIEREMLSNLEQAKTRLFVHELDNTVEVSEDFDLNLFNCRIKNDILKTIRYL